MKTNTKQKILEVGASIIHQKGYNNTGLNEILSAAKVPKGSFYNFFKNKEDFGLQVIDFFSDFFEQFSKDILEEITGSPLKRLEKLLDRFMDFYISKDYTCGCPVGNLSQELGDLSPAFQKKLSEAINKMVDIYARVLIKAQEGGELSKELNAEEAANFIVASWHGALIRMKVTKGIEPLMNHKDFIFNHILKP